MSGTQKILHNDSYSPSDLIAALRSAHAVLLPQRALLNQMDREHGRHGDEILDLIAVLATVKLDRITNPLNLSNIFDLLAKQAERLNENATASLYASGFRQFSLALAEHNLSISEFASYIQFALTDEPEQPAGLGLGQGQLAKALLKGLSAWETQVDLKQAATHRVSMSFLFDVGVTYMKARQSGMNKLDAITHTAIQHSPLQKPDYRRYSGEILIKDLLASLQQQAT